MGIKRLFSALLIIVFLFCAWCPSYAWDPDYDRDRKIDIESGGTDETTQTTETHKSAARSALDLIKFVAQSDCSTITEGFCRDTDDGALYYWDGDSVESVGSGTGCVEQSDCSTITSGCCIDTDDGVMYDWDGDSVELVGPPKYDNSCVPFGADSEFKICHDASNSEIEIRNSSDTVLVTFDDGGGAEFGVGQTIRGHELDFTPDVDHGVSGVSMGYVVVDSSQSNVAIMQPMHVASDGEYETSDADDSHDKCSGVLGTSGTGTQLLVREGSIRDDSLTFTVAEDYCVSETPANVVDLCSLESLETKIYVGEALTANVLYVDINKTYQATEASSASAYFSTDFDGSTACGSISGVTGTTATVDCGSQDYLVISSGTPGPGSVYVDFSAPVDEFWAELKIKIDSSSVSAFNTFLAIEDGSGNYTMRIGADDPSSVQRWRSYNHALGDYHQGSTTIVGQQWYWLRVHLVRGETDGVYEQWESSNGTSWSQVISQQNIDTLRGSYTWLRVHFGENDGTATFNYDHHIDDPRVYTEDPGWQ